MTTPVTKMQAVAARDLVRANYPDGLEVVLNELGTNRYTITVTGIEFGGSATFAPQDLDQGNGGIPLEPRKRLNALVEGTEYVAPVYQTMGEFLTGGSGRYDDVMTHGGGQLHASNGQVVDGGIVETPEGSEAPEGLIPANDASLAEMLGVVQQIANGDAAGALTAALASTDPLVAAAAAATVADLGVVVPTPAVEPPKAAATRRGQTRAQS
jgi:hypothetical protein